MDRIEKNRPGRRALAYPICRHLRGHIMMGWLLLGPGLLLGQPADNFAGQFGPVWARAVAYTQEVAEAMPAAQYGYRPSPEQMSFGEQLHHLTRNLYTLSARYIREEPVPPVTSAPDTLTKAQLMAALDQAMAYATETLGYLEGAEAEAVAPDFWSPEGATKAIVFLLMRDHLTHHRAQLIVYLRLQGISPPRYRGW